MGNCQTSCLFEEVKNKKGDERRNNEKCARQNDMCQSILIKGETHQQKHKGRKNKKV